MSGSTHSPVKAVHAKPPYLAIVQMLFKIIFFDQLAVTITFPLLTLIFFDSHTRLFSENTSLATRSIWFGIASSLPNTINLFFAPLFSSLSDVYGRKKLLLLEIASAAFFTFSMGLGVYLGQLWLIFVGLSIRGIFSRSNPTALSIIGDTVPGPLKITYMGYLQFAISLGASLGPIAGGYFATRFLFKEMNFGLPFFIASCIAIINAFFTATYFKETWVKQDSQTTHPLSWSAIRSVLFHEKIISISLLLFLLQLSWSMYYQYIPPTLKILFNIDAHQLGWFQGMIAMWLVITTGFFIKPLQRLLTLRTLLIIAIVVLLMGLLLTLFSISSHQYHLLVWIAAFPIAAGDVIAYSVLTALYSNSVSIANQGKVMAVCFIVVGLAWSCTGFIGGYLFSLTPTLPMLVSPIALLIALLLLLQSFGKRLVEPNTFA